MKVEYDGKVYTIMEVTKSGNLTTLELCRPGELVDSNAPRHVKEAAMGHYTTVEIADNNRDAVKPLEGLG